MNKHIILTCNKICNLNSFLRDQEYEEIEIEFLSSFRKADLTKICENSLVFTYTYTNKLYARYEVVESDPPMEPEQLYNIWRLLYE